MNPITVFQLASWTIGLWDYWLVGIEAGAGPIWQKDKKFSVKKWEIRNKIINPFR